MNIGQAILHLYPDAVFGRDFHVRDDMDGRGPYLEAWALPGEPPTDAELAAAWEAAQPAVRLEAVRQARAAEYPPIGDQLDALWKGGAAAAAMLDQILAVKARHPKP